MKQQRVGREREPTVHAPEQPAGLNAQRVRPDAQQPPLGRRDAHEPVVALLLALALAA